MIIAINNRKNGNNSRSGENEATKHKTAYMYASIYWTRMNENTWCFTCIYCSRTHSIITVFNGNHINSGVTDRVGRRECSNIYLCVPSFFSELWTINVIFSTFILYCLAVAIRWPKIEEDTKCSSMLKRESARQWQKETKPFESPCNILVVVVFEYRVISFHSKRKEIAI